jgi:hypothetical protein
MEHCTKDVFIWVERILGGRGGTKADANFEGFAVAATDIETEEIGLFGGEFGEERDSEFVGAHERLDLECYFL